MNWRWFPRWLQVFLGGVVLYAVTGEALRATNNPNYIPTVILLGAFVVPVTFVIYFYEHVRDRDISQPLLTSCFLVGGTVGLVAAGVLEYGSLRGLGIPGLVTVGLIEESVKLIFPIAMYVGWQYRHEADGLLFGVAAGMGFAALETMGYALVSVIQSKGDVGVLQQVLMVRGLLSPAGHAAWTGLVCAVIWRERERHHRGIFSAPVFGAWVMAIVLHTLWDVFGTLDPRNPALAGVFFIGLVVITITSVTLLIRRYLEARRSLVGRPLNLPPL